MGEPLEFLVVNPWTKIDPAIPIFDLSTFRKFLAKHQDMSRTVLVGPGLGIAKYWLWLILHWLEPTLSTLVSKLPPGGGPGLHMV